MGFGLVFARIEELLVPFNRQGFATLQARKGLRNKSGKPFGENYFRTLKPSSQASRYGNCPEMRNAKLEQHLMGATGNRPSNFRVKDWLDGPAARHRLNWGFRPTFPTWFYQPNHPPPVLDG